MQLEMPEGERWVGRRQWFKGLGVVRWGRVVPVTIWTRYGDRRPNPWLNDPRPNVTYYVGPNRDQLQKGVRFIHVFKTDSQGFTDSAVAERAEVLPADRAGKRWDKASSSPQGFPGGNYDRGHLIAAQLGAGMEAINLVSMPASVNRRHLEPTAIARGFPEIAELIHRLRDDGHHTRGTLTGSGEFASASYRDFELAAIPQLKRARELRESVTLSIKPQTFRSEGDIVTDVLYVRLFLGSTCIVRWQIDCDVG